MRMQQQIRIQWTLLCLLSTLSLLSIPVWGQNGAPAGTKIGAIHVKGQKTYSAEQVIAATGLKPGQVFNAEQLNAAAEKLTKSGAFSDVAFSYVPERGAMSIGFDVVEAKARTCHFDNFVWASDDEINSRLKKELPLYNGMAPETGGLLDEIPGVLEQLSKEKGISVHVSRRVQQNAIGDPNWSHMYAAEGANVTVVTVRFDGTLTVNPDDLQKETGGLVGHEYSAFQTAIYGFSRIAPFYRERGYLKVKVETKPVTVTSHRDGTSDFGVQVAFAVNEGAVYRWNGAEWSGNEKIASPSLDALTGMKANEIANAKKIDEGWAAVEKEYSKSGDLEVHVAADAAIAEDSKTVRYRASVAEGPLYHMGSLSINGVAQALVNQLKSRWKLKPGDVYNQEYIKEFAKKELTAASQGQLKPGAKLGISVAPDRVQHTVDVTYVIK